MTYLWNPRQNRRLDVTVIDMPPLTWESRSQVFQVEGSHAPVVAAQEMASATGTLVVMAEHRVDRIQLLYLMLDGGPMHLVSTCAEVDDIVFVPFRVSDPWWKDKGGPRAVEIEFKVVGDHTLGGSAARTYEEAATMMSTYQAAAAHWSSYDDAQWNP